MTVQEIIKAKSEKIEKRGKELWKRDDFVQNYEVEDLDQDNENGLRIYCTQFPDCFTFQIRTHKEIIEWGKGKKRNMISHIQLTINDVEQILKYMKNYNHISTA